MYKGLVDCKMPKKDNSNRSANESSHYLHSHVNMRPEQAFKFEKEHLIFSADAMNKIQVRVLCVRRYHQIRHTYKSDDAPVMVV